MMDETQLGKLAVWRVHGGSDELCLHIDLDHNRAVTLTIGRDGRTTAMLSDRVAEWLAKEVGGGISG